MKHVFVETNFLVDLLRPLPTRDAASLFSRVGTDVNLYIPWVSISEAKRTISTKIVEQDLGFADAVTRFSVKQLRSAILSTADMPPIQALVELVKKTRASALSGVDAAVDLAAQKMTIIPPSAEVVAKTMSLYPIKSLPPFDEMVLGAVLCHAAQLRSEGKADLYFCNANTKDFGPTNGNNLQREYASCGLIYLGDFNVP